MERILYEPSDWVAVGSPILTRLAEMKEHIKSK